jgi:PAS domain S-box-containing protein
MDLILAHKRAMKLGELSGLSIVVQTSLATAVSEIARCAIEFGKRSSLLLAIDIEKGRKMLKAIIVDSVDYSSKCLDATTYAKRLVDEVEFMRSGKDYMIVLKQFLSFQGLLTDSKIESIVHYFESEPPISAYDELRRKNYMLQAFAEKLKESESTYRILTDSLPVMMFSTNNRGVINYGNKWLKDYLGTLPNDLSGKEWQDIIHPTEHSVFSKELSNAVARQISFNGQFRFREKDTDDYYWHLISILPLKNEKQMITQWTGFIVDIHAQKMGEQTLKDNKILQQAQEELHHHQDELQRKVVELNRSNHELEQFAHLATHDLQEPLRKLFFYSDTLKRKFGSTIDPSGVVILNNMANAATRMKELINDLLSYSQLQKQVVHFEDVKLNDVIKEVIRDLDLVVKEKAAKIEIADIPAIRGNTLRLRQLFNNLISNSLKYSKEGVPPHIQVNCNVDGPDLIINLTDNGIGFEEKHKEKIFGLFERLHTRDQFPGTGIGLSICRKIAELHRGSISATSVLNESSTFEIRLPLTQPEIVESR